MKTIEFKTTELNKVEFELVESETQDPCEGECEFGELSMSEFPCAQCLAYCDRKYHLKSIDK